MATLQIIDYSAKAFAVIGDTKQVKDELKNMGGKFNKYLSCGVGWVFPIKARQAVETFINGGGTVAASVPTIAKAETKRNDKEYLNEYLDEMRKAWGGDDKMIEYEKSIFSSAVRLSNGGLVVFEKPRIETRFCFGYSCSPFDNESNDNAERMAHFARTNEQHFLNANLEGYDEKIEALQTNCGEGSNYKFIGCSWYLKRLHYLSQKEPLNLFEFVAVHWGELQDNPQRYGEVEKMSDEDRTTILEGLKHERNKFEKRLQAYLKRYGLSKLNVWTYWRDE